METQNKYHNVIIIAIIIIVITLLTLFFSGNNSLDKYSETSFISSNQENESKENSVEKFKTYYNKEQTCIMKVPNDWTEVYKNNIQSYIHKPSSTAIEIKITGYNPKNNTLKKEEVASNIQKAGYNPLEYIKTSNSSYICSYESNDWIYINLVSWNLKNTAEVIATIKKDNYNKMYSLIIECIKSFEWKSDIIPQSGQLIYFDYGNFEIFIPSNWTSSTTDNSIFLNHSSGSNITIQIIATNLTFEKVTENTYTKTISNKYSQYKLESFSNQNNTIEANFKYKINDVEKMVYNRVITNGKYEYNILIDYKPNDYQIINRDVINLLCLFRLF